MKSFIQFCQALSEGWGAERQKQEHEAGIKKWNETLERHKDHPENHKLLRYMRMSGWNAPSAEKELTSPRPRLTRDEWNKYMARHEAQFGPMKEEFEQIDEAKLKHSIYQIGVTSDKDSLIKGQKYHKVHRVTVARGENEEERAKAAVARHYGDAFHEITSIKKALFNRKYPEFNKDISEEVEQIDEISKRTLGSYINRAAADISKQDKAGNPEKGTKRLKNIIKATNRLTKEETEELNEWNAQGHKHSSGDKWMEANGYENVGGTKHSKWKHKDTGHTVTGWGYHGKEIEASVARKARNAVLDHHVEKNIPYAEWK